MKVHHGAERPFTDAPVAVVAIRKTSVGFHVGIVHRSDGETAAKMLHLAWHFQLRNEPADERYHWVEPTYPALRARQVAAMCRLIAKRAPKVPYAFSNPDTSFDPTSGDFLFGPTKLGLTCASFVLGVFGVARLPLAVLESWPPAREGDAEWQEWIISQLVENGAEDDHVNAVRNEVGAVRFRPDEVASASAFAPPAALFDQITAPAAALRDLLDRG